jgi:hypothetical protein
MCVPPVLISTETAREVIVYTERITSEQILLLHNKACWLKHHKNTRLERIQKLIALMLVNTHVIKDKSNGITRPHVSTLCY